MDLNTSLRYGFDLDRDYLLDFMMRYDFWLPIVTALTLHPIVMYLLLVESKAMKKEIRRGYIFTHLSVILNEWSFCFLFRLYPIIPYAAIYCGGPMCELGLGKQTLTTLLSIPVILINPPFNFLLMQMHQMLVPTNSKWKLSMRTQLLLGLIHTSLMIVNCVGFGVFGRDHDRAEQLMKEPELAMFASKGGTIFLFGPPGDPQYFQWELLTFLVAMTIIAPPLVFFTADSINIIASTNDKANLSGSTQAMTRRMMQVFFLQSSGATICYIIPLSFMFSCMFIDTSSIPGWLYAPLRILMPIVFSINGHQFGILFVVKNPTYRKTLTDRFHTLPFCTVKRSKVQDMRSQSCDVDITRI